VPVFRHLAPEYVRFERPPIVEVAKSHRRRNEFLGLIGPEERGEFSQPHEEPTRLRFGKVCNLAGRTCALDEIAVSIHAAAALQELVKASASAAWLLVAVNQGE